MSIDRAISIRQPFVELILQGVKQEEYRSRPTNIRERVYLYASLQPFDSDEEWAKVGKDPGQLPVGLIVGSVEIANCRPEPGGDGYAYLLREPMRLTQPLKPLNQPQPVFWRPEISATHVEAAQTKVPKQKGKREPPRTYVLSPALAAIVGPNPLPRNKIVSMLWAYIEENKLQDQQDKRIVNADDKLLTLFGKRHVSLYEMADLLGEHVR